MYDIVSGIISERDKAIEDAILELVFKRFQTGRSNLRI